MRFLLTVVLWVFLFEITLVGASSTDEEVLAEIGFVCIGAKPMRGYNELGEMKLGSLESVPPARMYYKVAANGDWRTVSLTLNVVSSMVKLPAEKPIHFFLKEGEGEYRKYLSVSALGKGERRLILLARQGQSWKETPGQQFIELNTPEIKESQIVMENLSHMELSCQLGDRELLLAPMKGGRYRQSEPGLCRISARYQSGRQVVINTAVRLRALSNQYFYIFYDADPRTNAGSLVGVCRIMIPQN